MSSGNRNQVCLIENRTARLWLCLNGLGDVWLMCNHPMKKKSVLLCDEWLDGN
jgi:hypothetical protein